MANYYSFESSDKINIFFLLLDSSSSMDNDEGNVKTGLRMYKKSFENFPESDSIAVSVSTFSNTFCPKEFRPINEFSTEYSTYGATALFYSIVKGAEHLMEYVREVTVRNRCTPRVTFILFSDGEPCRDPGTLNDAKVAIERLNYAGVTTVFVAFGNAISSDFGKELGFMSTIDVNNREVLVDFLGVELSNSCKEQSKSLKALGADFFSKAANANSDSVGYSQATAQALEDDSWIDEI